MTNDERLAAAVNIISDLFGDSADIVVVVRYTHDGQLVCATSASIEDVTARIQLLRDGALTIRHPEYATVVRQG